LLGQLTLLIYSTGLLTMTTPPLTLTAGLQRLLGWLSRFRVPVEEIALIITLGLTFLPLIQQQLDRVLTAQLARGADFRGGTWEMRGRNALALFIPLLVSNLRRAEDLALAMEARGYQVGARRTHLQTQVMTRRDYVFLAVVIAVTMATYAIWR
jgi:energy-coupling factor transport system permease protein